MLKKVLITVLLSLSLVGAGVAPAAADTTSTVSDTLTSKAAVTAVAKKMAEERKWLGYACAFQTDVKALLALARAGKNVPLATATKVLKVVNKAGDGSCQAANVVAGTIADMQITFAKHKKVYIKQVTVSPSAWKVLSKIKVTRYVGKTSTSTTKWYYSVGLL